jgi:hypothetical protein
MRRALALLVLSSGCLLTSQPAAADPPGPPFATQSGTCAPSSSRGPRPITFKYGSTTLTADPDGLHGAAVVALRADSGSATVGFGPGAASVSTLGTSWAPSDITGGHGWPVTVLCTAPTTFTVSWFDLPAAPVSYTGFGTSVLAFSGPQGVAFDAEVEPLDGAVTVGSSVGGGTTARAQTFSTPGTYGVPSAHGLDGSPTSIDDLKVSGTAWRVTINARPKLLESLSLDSRFVRPGGRDIAHFSLGDSTTVTSWLSQEFDAVRSIAQGQPSSAGDHVVDVDGRGDDGKPLPDGDYTLWVEASDAFPDGNIQTDDLYTSVTVDGTPPAISVATSAPFGPRSHVQLSANDSGSGLETAVLRVDGRRVKTLASGRSLYRPKGGWKPGRHDIELTATDKVGNVRRAGQVFRVGRGRGQ